MAKSTSYIHQNKQTSAMSPPHAHTSGIVSSVHPQDDDDDDICPICEGACTCNNKIAPPTPTPLASSSRQTHIQIVPQAHPSPSIHSHSTIATPLKIKLTIPATLLSRSRLPTSEDLTLSSKKQDKNKSADAHCRTKRPARPHKTGGSTTTHPTTISKAKNKRVPKPTSPAKDTTEQSSRYHVVGGSDDYTRSGTGSASSRRSHDTSAGNSGKANPKCIPNRGFPTFVSADEFSSENESSAGSSSGSEESELTDFSDSSIAEEEENFIRTTEEQRTRAHDKARIKRELLGDGMTKRKERRNNWEIRSRKKSVSPIDDKMDVDSDETDDEAEEGIEQAEGNDGEDDEDDGTGPARGSYVGIATGWSDDEESSFDADLFFAAGLDSDSGPDISVVPGHEVEAAADDSIDTGSPVLAQGTFEITEGWDGSVIFTNGLQDGQGLLDWDFEANAAQLLIEAQTTSESNSGSDIRMSESEGDMGDSEDETDGLEEVDSNDGDTTEDELVDDRGLPTARAMRLFRPPVTPLFSINPLSTMSPGPRVRDVLATQSPRPSDILGHDFGDEEDDAPEPPMSEIGSIILSASSDRATPRFPLMGMFEASKADSLCHAVIDGSRDVIPSPFQRSRRRRPSKSVSARSITGGRDRSLSQSHASFATSSTLLGMPSLSDEPIFVTSPNLIPAEPICLDDVFDTSILDSDPVDASITVGQPHDTTHDPEACATDDRERHLQSLSRWDRIPMGTFRRSRENGPLSDSPGELPYVSVIRSSPFNGVWPSDKSRNKPPDSPSKKGKARRRGSRGRVDMDISPVILPVRDRDGDHTQTGHSMGQTSHGPLHPKSRKDKESRRDKMHKRKTMMGTSIGRRHQQHHHMHGHHPNSKGRLSGSMQRTGIFGGGSVPPLNL